MQTVAQNKVAQNKSLRHIQMLILLGVGLSVIVLGLIRLKSSPPSPVSESMYSYFANSAQRTGTSTNRLVKDLQLRLERDANDWEAYGQLGVAYLQQARETGDPTYYQRSEEVLNKALALEPGDYVATAAMGALQLARHQFADALEWGERARQINAHRTYAYGVVVDAQVELGRYEEAVQTLQAMVDLRPDMSSYTRISYIRELYGDNEGALEMMQQAANSASTIPENAAWVRTQLANLYFSQGNLEQAELEYRRALVALPDYVYALGGLGHLRAAQGRTDEAVELLTQVTSIMPLPEFVILLGDVYESTGQTEAAQTQYELVRVIEKLYQANGVDMNVEIALFNADHDQDITETVTLARQAFAQQPSVHAADVLAWALYKAGHYQEAQTYTQQALRLGNNDALELFHAGMIHYALGDNDMARTYLQQAVSANPHFSLRYAVQAQQLLSDLHGIP
jgi:tetratricopeptide (TPR) repeat protein